jgi:hypothetical protein
VDDANYDLVVKKAVTPVLAMGYSKLESQAVCEKQRKWFDELSADAAFKDITFVVMNTAYNYWHTWSSEVPYFAQFLPPKPGTNTPTQPTVWCKLTDKQILREIAKDLLKAWKPPSK